MIEVLISIRVVQYLLKDLHYATGGEEFYGLHLLADKVDFRGDVDDLREAYYLGLKGEIPPMPASVDSLASTRIPTVSASDNRARLESLFDACHTAIYAIEGASSDGELVGGVKSILDSMSQKLLTLKGLCWRSLNGKLHNNS